MEKINKKERAQKWLPIIFKFGLFLFFVLTILFSKKVFAATSPTIITYQGKLLISGRLATTTQSMQFTLYDSLSGGTALYTASGTLGTPQSINITPSQGLFSINLGDTGTNSLTPAIFQNNGSVFLEVKVGSDILTPRKQITAVPYSFNAAYLDGVGVNTISSTTYIPKSDSSGNFTFNSTTINTSTISNLTTANATSTNLFSSGLTFTNANGTSVTSTNLFASLFAFTTASGSSITSTNAFFTNLATTNFSPANITATNVTSTNLFSTNLTFTSASGTSVTTTNLNVTGALNLPNDSITDAMVVDTITASNYLLLTGGTLSGQLNFTTASGTMVTSTNLITTNATSTLFFSTTGTFHAIKPDASDGLFITANNGTPVANFGPANTANVSFSGAVNILSGLLNFSTANGTSITSTNAFFSTLAATNFSLTNLTATSVTTTNLNVSGPLTFNTASGTMVTSTNLVTTNATSTNFFSSGLTFTNANGTSITSTNLFASLFAFTNASGTSVTTTNLNVTGSNNLITTGSAGQFPYYAANGFSLSPTSTLFILPTRLIGIGTTTPQSKLTIQGDGTANPFSIVSSTPASASMLTVLTNGNVGINTSSPIDTLAIQGGLQVIGGVTTTGLAVFNDAYFKNGTLGFGFSDAGTATGIINAFGFNGGFSAMRNLRIDNGVGGTIATFSGATLATALNGALTTVGKVGIGTTTLSSTLTVQGDGTANPFSILSSTPAAASMFTILTNGNVGINSSTPIATLAVQGTGTSNPFAILSSTGSSLLSILTNGNVGIGSSTPSTKLAVQGSSYFSQTSTFGGNISNIIDSNTVVSQVATVSVGKQPVSVFVSGRYAYTANEASGTISVVDISNPAVPVQIATTSVGTTPTAIYVSGRYAYVTNQGSNSISVVDISNPAVPRQVATTSVGQNPLSIYVSGRYAYVANGGDSNISVVDVSNPLAPKQIATAAVGSTPQSVFISGRFAYVANFGSNIISVVDISNPSAPVQVATTIVGVSPTSIYVSGRFAYVANFSSNTISVVDVSNPTAPVQVATTSVGSAPGSIFVSGRYAYTANGSSNNISVIDISGTEVTSLIAHSAEVGNLQSRNDIFAQGNIIAGTSLLVGAGGIMSNGSLSVFASSTGATSSIFDISSAQTSSIFKVFANGNIGIGTSTPTEKLSVVGNISNVIDTGTVISQIATTSVGLTPIGVYVSGRYAYVVNAGDDTISVIDVSNPAVPVQIATTSVGTTPLSLYVSGRYAYVANENSSNISVVDISNPAAPKQIATTSVGVSPFFIYVSGRYAYVANEFSNTISVVDISNPAAPKQIATTSVGAAPFSIYVSGRYAYTANNSSNTISVIDVSDPSVPTQVATTSVGSGPAGISVSGRYAYTANGGNDTISVIDVSNPAVPVQIATTSLGTGLDLGSVYVSGRYMYVTSFNLGKVFIVDVSNPLSPRKIAIISVGSNPQGVFVSGRYAYVTNRGNNSLSIIDISGTEVTSLIAHSAEVGNLQSRNDIFAQGNIMAGTGLMVGAGGIMSQGTLSIFASSTGSTSSIFDVSSAISTSTSILKVFANGKVAIGTSTATEKLSVVGNISNIIDSGTTITQIATTSVGSHPHAVFVSGKYAYIANNQSTNISVVDVSNPFAPVQIATTSVGGQPSSIYVSGRYAYVANETDNTISVVDISNPKAPTQIATTSVSGSFPETVFVSGKYLYTANLATSGLSVIDISNPKAPVLVASSSVGNSAVVFVSGRYAYLGGGSTFSVVDISDPLSPVRVATTSVSGTIFSIYVSGRYAYMANDTPDIVSVIDISNPSAPVQIATTSVGVNSEPSGIFVSGRYAYVANSFDKTISIVDVSIPSTPTQVAKVSVTTANANPTAIFVSGRYAYVADSIPGTIDVFDISGTEVTSLIAHSAEVGNIQSRNDIFAQGNIMAGTSLMVGAGGIMSNGALSVFASSTGSTSSIFDISSAVSTSSLFKVFANGSIMAPNIGAPAVNSDFVCFRTSNGQITHQAANCTASSARFKENIQSLSQADLLAEVKALRSVSFDFKEGQIPDHGLNGGGKASSGFIAEEVALIDPMLVIYTDNYTPEDLAFEQANYPGAILVKDGKTLIPQTVDYARVSVLLTGALQDLDSRLSVYASTTEMLSSALTVDINNKNIIIGTSTNPYNLVITGNLSLNNPDLINKLSFATSSLFESSVGNFAGARAFTFNAPNFSDTSADSYLISLRSNNIPVFSVAANGDVSTKGSYFGSNIVLGTSTNPGDLAERVDIAVDDTVESGDVMVIDQNSPDTYRRSGEAYEQSVAGVISSNPTIIVGNGKTDYTAVMAMVGRVPVKVSNVNGDIKKGDLLITASTTGFAMKYDPAKDNNNKMVAVIGVALESLSTSTGKVLALIRTGWIYNRDQAIGSLQNNIKQIAIAEGVNLDAASEPDNLNVRSSGSQLAVINGEFNLQGNSIVNVASITGKDNKWRIDEWGNLIQKITTDKGDKEIYGLQSSDKQEIVISGTSTLENGTKKVILTDLDQAIIDKTVPLKIQITMSGETKGVYVSERSFDSFVVKENDNGQGNASFDWTVIAKLLAPEESTGSSSDQQASGSSDFPNDVVSSTVSVTTTASESASSTVSVQNIDQSVNSGQAAGNNSTPDVNTNSVNSTQAPDLTQTKDNLAAVSTDSSTPSTP